VKNVKLIDTNELATHSKNKNIGDLNRGINEFKDYQLKTILLKGENVNLLADSDNFKWVEELYSELLNVHRVRC
jgi:hypothetical protein